MPLGIDSTIRYALRIPADESLTQSELANPTPYNTRLHAGPPPTPIANPGLASIEAAAHPAKGRYLYFVAKPDKAHRFFTASCARLSRSTRPRTATADRRRRTPRTPGRALAVAADAERGLRGGRARLGVRRCATSSRRSSRRRCGEVESRERDGPYKLDAARLLGSELPSVNTIVARAGLLDRHRDPRAGNRLLQAGDRGRRRGGGGVWQRCPGRGLLRRGEWPPDVARRRPRDPRDARAGRGAVRARAGQTLIDLPYPSDGDGGGGGRGGRARPRRARGARRAGSRELRALDRPPAPVDAMRRAARLDLTPPAGIEPARCVDAADAGGEFRTSSASARTAARRSGRRSSSTSAVIPMSATAACASPSISPSRARAPQRLAR